MNELIDVEVPVRILFRVPPGVDQAALAEFTENVFEHGTIRDCFREALDGAYSTGSLLIGDNDQVVPSPDWYDGYSVEHETVDPPCAGMRGDG